MAAHFEYTKYNILPPNTLHYLHFIDYLNPCYAMWGLKLFTKENWLLMWNVFVDVMWNLFLLCRVLLYAIVGRKDEKN